MDVRLHDHWSTDRPNPKTTNKSQTQVHPNGRPHRAAAGAAGPCGRRADRVPPPRHQRRAAAGRVDRQVGGWVGVCIINTADDHVPMQPPSILVQGRGRLNNTYKHIHPPSLDSASAIGGLTRRPSQTSAGGPYPLVRERSHGRSTNHHRAVEVRTSVCVWVYMGWIDGTSTLV